MKEVDSTSAAANEDPRNRIFAGIAFISVGIFFLSTMDALVKWLVTEDYHPVQLLAVRSWIILALFALILPWRGGLTVVRTPRWPVHFLRCSVGLCAPLFFFLALRTLPLAEAVALFFSSTFIMTAMSALILKEPVGVRRWSGVIVGFIGVLIVTRPGSAAFQFEAIYVLLSSVAYSTLLISARWLSRTESTTTMVFYFSLTICLWCTPLLAWLWQPMPTNIVIGMLVFALLAVIGHLALTHAFTLAPVSVIAPYEYSAMVWAVLYGFLIWGEVPDSMTIAGTLIIVASGLYIARREALHQQSKPGGTQ